MEKKYYIAENDCPLGPFTPEELCEHGITPESRIYAKGWSEFRSVSEVPELATVLARYSKGAADATDPRSVDVRIFEEKIREQELAIARLKAENEALKTGTPTVDEEPVGETPMWEEEAVEDDYTPEMARRDRIISESVALMITLPIVAIIWFSEYLILGKSIMTGRGLIICLVIVGLIGFVIDRRLVEDEIRKIRERLERNGY